jgi:hypothetical protein
MCREWCLFEVLVGVDVIACVWVFGGGGGGGLCELYGEEKGGKR